MEHNSNRTLAQLVERLPYTQNVGGSNPSRPTIICGGGREAHCNGLQIRKTVSSNLTRHSKIYFSNLAKMYRQEEVNQL